MVLYSEIEFCMFGGREDGEHNSVGFVEIFKICATQDTFFQWSDTF